MNEKFRWWHFLTNALVSRRRLFGSLLAAQSLLSFQWLLHSCRTRDGRSLTGGGQLITGDSNSTADAPSRDETVGGQANGKEKADLPEKKPQPGDGRSSSASDPLSAPVCRLSNKINLEELTPPPSRFLADMRTYGSLTSALLVVEFPSYQQVNYKGKKQKKGLTEIYICSEDGELIVGKTLDYSQDIDSSGVISYQVFDHVSLPAEKKLCVVGVLYDKLALLSKNIPVNFVRPVKELEPIPIISLSGSVSQVKDGGLIPRNLIDLDGSSNSIVRRDAWVVPLSGAVSFPSESLKDCIVCDLMGRLLSRYGERFTDYYRYSAIVCFRKIRVAGGDAYTQDVVRLS